MSFKWKGLCNFMQMTPWAGGRSKGSRPSLASLWPEPLKKDELSNLEGKRRTTTMVVKKCGGPRADYLFYFLFFPQAVVVKRANSPTIVSEYTLLSRAQRNAKRSLCCQRKSMSSQISHFTAWGECRAAKHCYKSQSDVVC